MQFKTLMTKPDSEQFCDEHCLKKILYDMTGNRHPWSLLVIRGWEIARCYHVQLYNIKSYIYVFHCNYARRNSANRRVKRAGDCLILTIMKYAGGKATG